MGIGYKQAARSAAKLAWLCVALALATTAGMERANAQQTTRTSSTSSTQSVTTVTSPNVRINTYETRITGEAADGTVLYDQTFTEAYGAAGPQGGVEAARLAIANASGPGVAITGPTPVSQTTTLLDSSTDTQTANETSQTSFGEETIGPATVITGALGLCQTLPAGPNRRPTNCQYPGNSFSIGFGDTNYNTHSNTHSAITETRTTTETWVVREHRRMVGTTGAATTTTASSSRTETVSVVTNPTVRNDTYEITVTGQLPNGRIVYSQTFSEPFSAAGPQRGVQEATGAIRDAAGSNIPVNGPTEASSTETVTDSDTDVATETTVTPTTFIEEDIGPGTIFIGDFGLCRTPAAGPNLRPSNCENPGTPFRLVSSDHVNYNAHTNTHSAITETHTTTETRLIRQHWRLVGVAQNGTTNTQSSSRTETQTVITNPTVQTDTFEITVTGELPDGRVVYSQRFSEPFSGAGPQLAAQQATAAIRDAAGSAIPVNGPTEASSTRTMTDSDTDVQTQTTSASTQFIQVQVGPGTLTIGDLGLCRTPASTSNSRPTDCENPGSTHYIGPGETNINTHTNTHSDITETRTTTETWVVREHWRLVGVTQGTTTATASSSRTETVTVVTNPTVRNDTYEVIVTGELSDGRVVYSQTFSEQFSGAGPQLAAQQATAAIRDAAGSAIPVNGPTQADSTETMTDSDTDTDTQTASTETTFIETTIGPGTVITGNLGLCRTPAAGPNQRPTSCENPGTPFSISFNDVNLNAHTNTHSDITETQTTTENWVIREHWRLVGMIQTATTTSLASSRNPSIAGDAVTFMATVAPTAGGATPTGTVTFSIDGAAQAPVTLSGGTASFTTSTLTPGAHAITAVYSGDANFATSTGALSQTVNQAATTLAIASSLNPSTVGTPVTFTASVTPAGASGDVTFSIDGVDQPPTRLTGGTASLTTTALAIGAHQVTARYSGDIMHLASASTPLTQSVEDNFTEQTVALIEDVMLTRGAMILSNQPDIQRRIDRLNGTGGSANPAASLMAWLPSTASGDITMSASLAAIQRLSGEAPSRFDIWFQGTYARWEAGGPEGNFGMATLGADWLATPNLLIGGFIQLDHITRDSTFDAATASGTGWLAGPYLTARLSDNLFLDMAAGAGTSSNQVSPLGTYEDTFDSTRWMASATLQGEWAYDAWTFRPRASANWFGEKSASYTDSFGATIPSVGVGLGRFAAGPGISYRHITQSDVVIDTGLRFDAVVDYEDRQTGPSGFDELHGRVEGSFDFAFPTGARLGVSASYDGIGSNKLEATSGKIRFSIPIN